jgi:hypothetical protein
MLKSCAKACRDERSKTENIVEKKAWTDAETTIASAIRAATQSEVKARLILKQKTEQVVKERNAFRSKLRGSASSHRSGLLISGFDTLEKIRDKK